MPVPSSITDLDTTPANNSPAGSESAKGTIDDYLRTGFAFTKTLYDTKAALVGPSFTTPTLGVATAASINKVVLTTPATSATLTIADGKTLTASNTLTFSGTDGSTLNVGTGGTLGTAAFVSLTAPGAIGSVTPSTGAFTTLSATGLITGRTTSNGQVLVSTNGVDTDLNISIAALDAQFVNTGVSSKFSFILGGTTRAQISSTGLAVTGTLSATSTVGGTQFNSTSSSAALPGFGVSSGCGIYNAGSNILGFSTNGTEVMRLDTSGNLGLGVTPSAWQSTIRAMDFGGGSDRGATFTGAAIDIGLIGNAYYNSGFIYKTTAAATSYEQEDGVHRWRTAASGTAGNTITFSTAMSLGADSVLNVCAATATPANGSTSARLIFGTTSGFGIYYGSGAPTVSAAQGSIYLRSDGSSSSTRLYVNSNGSTTWVNFTSAS